MTGEPGRSQLDAALEKAFAYLAKRDRTASQVRARLLQEGFDNATSDEAISELERQGYVDDGRFARVFAEDRRNLDGWGSERIAARLRELGISADQAGAVTDGRGRDEELSDALALLERRLPAPPSDDRERERALGLLVRRGFELELAYDAVRAFGSPPH